MRRLLGLALGCALRRVRLRHDHRLVAVEAAEAASSRSSPLAKRPLQPTKATIASTPAISAGRATRSQPAGSFAASPWPRKGSST